jgi:hypothetical protein
MSSAIGATPLASNASAPDCAAGVPDFASRHESIEMTLRYYVDVDLDSMTRWGTRHGQLLADLMPAARDTRR